MGQIDASSDFHVLFRGLQMFGQPSDPLVDIHPSIYCAAEISAIGLTLNLGGA
jgi:hypothetical protein